MSEKENGSKRMRKTEEENQLRKKNRKAILIYYKYIHKKYDRKV